MLEYSGEYTVSDYLLANRIHLRSKRLNKVVWAFLLLLVAVQALMVWANPGSPLGWLVLLVGVLLVTYPYTILPILARRSFARQPQVHGDVTIILGSDRITDTSATGSSTHLWLHHILVSESMILLFTTPQTFIMLPRRFFKDADDFRSARSYLDAFPTGKKGYAAISRMSATDDLPHEQASLSRNAEGRLQDAIPLNPAVSGPAQPARQSELQKNALLVLKVLGAIAGFLLLVWGLFIILSVSLGIIDGTSSYSLATDLLGLVFFGVAPLALGAVLLLYTIRSLRGDHRN